MPLTGSCGTKNSQTQFQALPFSFCGELRRVIFRRNSTCLRLNFKVMFYRFIKLFLRQSGLINRWCFDWSIFFSFTPEWKFFTNCSERQIMFFWKCSQFHNNQFMNFRKLLGMSIFHFIQICIHRLLIKSFYHLVEQLALLYCWDTNCISENISSIAAAGSSYCEWTNSS